MLRVVHRSGKNPRGRLCTCQLLDTELQTQQKFSYGSFYCVTSARQMQESSRRLPRLNKIHMLVCLYDRLMDFWSNMSDDARRWTRGLTVSCVPWACPGFLRGCLDCWRFDRCYSRGPATPGVYSESF